MVGTYRWRGTLVAKVAAVVVLIGLAEFVFDADSEIGGVIGVLALAWLAALVLVRRAVTLAPIALAAAALFALALIDDPNPLALLLFGTALSLATLLPRRGFDDALTWAVRLVRHGVFGIVGPVRDWARVARVRECRGGRAGGIRAVLTMLILPVIGGALFIALFAGANPLIGRAFAHIALPDAGTVAWRTILAGLIVLAVWPSFRPSSRATAFGPLTPAMGSALDPGIATLVLSLVTFNAIFAVENILDLLFLWSGAPLPGGVTMADYAHQGAYSLIVTALLAGAFVLVALRPGSAGAASPAVRRLVAVWMAQNLLLVASSALRTLDYVDAYGMTVLRLAALAWMALVAVGLVLIGWRLLAGRSAPWLINANALAAAIVLTAASIVDLGATAATWNTRVALARGRTGPPLDLCYLARLGSSSLVPLARLERHARPALRDRLAYLRWAIQTRTAVDQANWRSWTWRNARRLATVEAIVGTRAPALRPAPGGRGCDGAITPPPPLLKAAPTPTRLTGAPQR